MAMSGPGPQPEQSRPSDVPYKRPGETHPAEYFTTPQVPIQEPIDPFPGRTFGDYEILERIARGGMGVVYKARQISLNRLVALKIIPGNELANPVERQRFRIEVEAAANIDHPRIVPIYEVGEHDGYYFYSMRLIEGGSLAQHMARYRNDPRAAARLIISAARGIHYAHQRGILHRDLKPANILLDSDGRPHVADFGVAKHLRVSGLDSPANGVESSRSDGLSTGDPAADSPRGRPPSCELELTQVGEIIGTPSYMAPEQASGKKGVVTIAADIYSLGAILYEMLTGRPPFKGPTRMATVRQVLTERPTPPRQLNPKIDRDLERICLKCLERDPQQRYASAEALAEDLERWLAGEPILAAPATWWYRVWKWVKRRPTMAALVGATALITILALAGITWQARLAHFHAERAWVAETVLRRERDQLRQQSKNWQRIQALRIVQEAWHHSQEGNWFQARQCLSQVPAEWRRWDWHWLDAGLRFVEQPVWQHPQLIGLVPHSQGWLAVIRDGQVWQLPSVGGTPHHLQTLRFPAKPAHPIPLDTEFCGADFFQDGTLAVWDRQRVTIWQEPSASAPLWTWSGNPGEVLQVFRSPQSSHTAVIYRSQEGDGYIALYPVETTPQLLRIPAGNPRAGCFVGEQHLLVITEQGHVFIWSCADSRWDRRPWQANVAVEIEHAALAPSGHFLLVRGDGAYQLGRWQPGWDRVWLEEPQASSARVQAATLSGDAQRYAVALSDGTILVGQLGGSVRSWRLPKNYTIRLLRFSPTAEELALLTMRGEIFRLPLDLAAPEATSVRENDHSEAPVGRWPSELKVSLSVDAASLNEILGATSDGRLLLAHTPPTTPTEIAGVREVASFGKPITTLAWSDAGRFVLVALSDGSLHLGQYCSKDGDWLWRSSRHTCAIEKLAVAPSGEWFATWDANRRLWLWDAELLMPVVELSVRSNECARLRVSENGLHLQERSGLWWTWRIPVGSPAP